MLCILTFAQGFGLLGFFVVVFVVWLVFVVELEYAAD